MDFSSNLTSQASPSMKYYSEKSILVKQINDIIYTISTGGVQYPKKTKSSINQTLNKVPMQEIIVNLTCIN